jgi:hypothetical protein
LAAQQATSASGAFMLAPMPALHLCQQGDARCRQLIAQPDGLSLVVAQSQLFHVEQVIQHADSLPGGDPHRHWCRTRKWVLAHRSGDKISVSPAYWSTSDESVAPKQVLGKSRDHLIAYTYSKQVSCMQ